MDHNREKEIIHQEKEIMSRVGSQSSCVTEPSARLSVGASLREGWHSSHWNLWHFFRQFSNSFPPSTGVAQSCFTLAEGKSKQLCWSWCCFHSNILIELSWYKNRSGTVLSRLNLCPNKTGFTVAWGMRAWVNSPAEILVILMWKHPAQPPVPSWCWYPQRGGWGAAHPSSCSLWPRDGRGSLHTHLLGLTVWLEQCWEDQCSVETFGIISLSSCIGTLSPAEHFKFVMDVFPLSLDKYFYPTSEQGCLVFANGVLQSG